ncbi:hypothetical protein ACFSM5_03675 [Lacibacterium aquatile]|uniref:Protein phosphatase 2C domain-containing protein n=1 Tax=Lacibacterium aquatile TaxID=1168082 RepID=A0ABW5DLG0_9PROT
MQIEAFSLGKLLADPGANEDRFVVLPGRAYAVIDGVTDRLGTRYDGMLSGRYAATIVKGALEHLLSAPDAPLDDPEAVVAIMTEALAAAYRRHDMLDAAAKDWNRRFACTLSLAAVSGDRLIVLLVGDSGVRINGSKLLQDEKDLDKITATLRVTAWPLLCEAVADPAEREKTSRLLTWNGTRNAAKVLNGLLSDEQLVGIETAAIAANKAALPHVPEADITYLVQGGIVHAQGKYLNNTESGLGYGCLDGFEIPRSLYQTHEFPLAEVETVELFTDGYFTPGEGFGVAAWESTFARVEREDPSKTGTYPSVKGSTAEGFADDRTYLGVRLG